MSPDSDTITLAPITPSAPFVLADSSFLTTLAQVEKQVVALTISDITTAQIAADLQIRLTSAGRKLEAAREFLKRPLIEKGREIDAAAKEASNRIERAKTTLKTALSAYDAELQRIAREAELTRQRELARLEKIRLAEEAEAKRKIDELARIAAEAAKKNEVLMLEIDDFGPAEPPPKTAVEVEIERVKFAPAPVMQRPTGIAFRVRLIHRVESVAALPDTFVIRSANDAAIRATFCAGYREGEPLPVCPGVVFTVDKTPVDTGRRVF